MIVSKHWSCKHKEVWQWSLHRLLSAFHSTTYWLTLCDEQNVFSFMLQIELISVYSLAYQE